MLDGIEPDIAVLCVKGESLRQQLLLRYCGNCHPCDLVSEESKYKLLARQGVTGSSVDSERGSLHLRRAGMTLHDVQVCWCHTM